MRVAIAAVNVTFTAQSYAVFAGLLAGFAFSGLCVYISRKPKPQQAAAQRQGSAQATSGEPDGTHPPIEVKDVAAAVFFAMVSLGMSSFLYSNLAGTAQNGQGAAITAVLFYGITLALSVLSLFYALALMMLEHPLTQDVAKTAYWVVTIAGTIIVLRFLAGSARDAALSRCHPGHICHLPVILSRWGIDLTLLIAGLLTLLITVALLEHEPKGRIVGALTHHPARPPGMVFILGFIVTTAGSLYLNTRTPKYRPPGLLIYACYGASILFIAFFALACGRVIAPRADVYRGDIIRFLRRDEIKYPMWAAVLSSIIILCVLWWPYALWVFIPAAVFMLPALWSELWEDKSGQPEEAPAAIADGQRTADHVNEIAHGMEAAPQRPPPPPASIPGS